jgi:predicted transcriptional regulator
MAVELLLDERHILGEAAFAEIVVKQGALDALSGKRRGAHISFASADLLWKVLTAKRWELLKAMAGRGAMTLREAARRADRVSVRCGARRLCA